MTGSGGFQQGLRLMTAPAPHPGSGTRTTSRHLRPLPWSSLGVQVPVVGSGVLGGGTERDWGVEEWGSFESLGSKEKRREVKGYILKAGIRGGRKNGGGWDRERVRENALRGSKLPISGGIQAEAARWPLGIDCGSKRAHSSNCPSAVVPV